MSTLPCYHAVEPVTGGRRVSIALFSPRAWKRIPPHALCELHFLPELLARCFFDQPEIDRTLGDTPRAGSKILGDLGDTSRKGSKTLGDFGESSSKDRAMPAEEMIERSEDDKEEDLKTSTSGMDADLQEWCLLPEVALPFAHLDASDGSISPLDKTKSHSCKGCLTAEGPRRIHRRIRDVDKATHVLHIDIAGPLTKPDDGYVYFLVGALRLPGFPLLIDVRLLQTRISAEVCHQLDVMVNYFESLCFEGFPITDAPRIRRLHSDRAREFTAAFFEKFLAHRRGLRSARPPTGVSRALRAQSVPRSVPESVPENRGVQGSVPRGVLGPSGLRAPECPKMSRECPQSVQNVSWTRWGHSRDTFWTLRSPGPEGPQGHPVGHSLGHPYFHGHSRGHSVGHSRPEGPERLL